MNRSATANMLLKVRPMNFYSFGAHPHSDGAGRRAAAAVLGVLCLSLLGCGKPAQELEVRPARNPSRRPPPPVELATERPASDASDSVMEARDTADQPNETQGNRGLVYRNDRI